MAAEYGQWKDGLCDCFGPTGFPSFCLACWYPCCTPCIFAKIASRLDWRVPSLHAFGQTTFLQWFRSLSLLAIIYMIAYYNYEAFSSMTTDQLKKDISYYGNYYSYHASDYAQKLWTYTQIFDFITFLCSTIFVILALVLRRMVRRRYLIPTSCDEGRYGENSFCGTVEDLVVSLCCWTCSLAQIARHTDAVGTTCDPMSDPGPIDTTHIPTGIPGVQPINTQPVFVNGMYNPSTGHYQLHDEPIVHADFNPSSIEVGQIVSNQAPAANSGHAAMATPIDHMPNDDELPTAVLVQQARLEK